MPYSKPPPERSTLKEILGIVTSVLAELKRFYGLSRTIFQPSYDPKRWSSRTQLESKQGYLDSWQAESNIFLYESISRFNLKKVLEIGSNSGNRLFQIAQSRPDVDFVGVDLNREAISLGNQKALELGLENLNFYCADIREKNFTSFLKNGSFDTLISWATLIYLHPIFVKRFFFAVDQSSISQICFIEQNSSIGSQILLRGLPIAGGPNWARNYDECLKRFCRNPEFICKTSNVPKEIWNPGGGKATLIIGERNKSK